MGEANGFQEGLRNLKRSAAHAPETQTPGTWHNARLASIRKNARKYRPIEIPVSALQKPYPLYPRVMETPASATEPGRTETGRDSMILVTGGAGYIGSHTCLQLLEAGHEVLVLDNFSTSKPEALRRVQQLAGRKLHLIKGDILDQQQLDLAFRHPLTAVIHFAGRKAVAESVAAPLAYYQINVAGTLQLLQAMQRHEVKNLVFSSSATVYGPPTNVPVREDAPLAASNPYGRSKLMAEEILRDLIHADPDWNIAILRYFNPVGAHPSGQIGEDPNGPPNNLMPYISQVAIGKRECLNIFGGDYPTTDGTGVRDYIHVDDLARGHLCALSALEHTRGLITANLGTGQGHSVLQVVQAFETVCGRTLPYRIAPRRAGDIAACWADPTAAHGMLGWQARKDLKAMCMDSWHWQQLNPDGYPPETEN